jgi:hypothetical protein
VNERAPRILAGVAMIVFPVLLLIGFILHPHLLAPHLATTAEELATKFRHNSSFHIGHMLVFTSVPFIIMSSSYVTNKLTAAGRIYGLVGGLVSTIGAVILAGDKGALCIVLSAFDTLNDADFASIRPALQAIVERRGLLMMFWALPLLPLGTIVQMAGMVKEGMVSPTNGGVAIVGLALLNNPDIDIVSSAGALLMCFIYIPLGVRIIASRI